MKQLLMIGLMVVAGNAVGAAEKSAAEAQAKLTAEIKSNPAAYLLKAKLSLPTKKAAKPTIKDGTAKVHRFNAWDYSRGIGMVFSHMKKFDQKSGYWIGISLPRIVAVIPEDSAY